MSMVLDVKSIRQPREKWFSRSEFGERRAMSVQRDERALADVPAEEKNTPRRWPGRWLA